MNKRIPRKKGQPANSKKHSDLYTDENPKGTIHGLKFATVEDAKASVAKIKKSSSLNNPNSKLKVGMTVSVVVNTEFKKDIPFIISPIANLFYKFHTL